MVQFHGIIRGAYRSLAGLFLGALLLACSASSDASPPLPEGLPVIMNALLRESRAFKQDLVIHQSDRYRARAEALAAEAGRLAALDGPVAFRALAAAFKGAADETAAAASEGREERIETLFGEAMDGCIACHHRFRDASKP